MARRRQKHLVEPKAFLSLALVVGMLWLATLAARKVPKGDGRTLLRFTFYVCLAAFVLLVFRLVRRAWARRSLFHKVERSIRKNLAALVRRRAQLVQQDAYGKFQVERWNKEISSFLASHIVPSLTKQERASIARNGAAITSMVENRVEAATRARPAFKAFSDNLTPIEFETFCAEQLRSAGWNARVTMQSRDQGVDVVAEKGGVRVVIQCKLYTRPVGNKSVQEAAAARAHEQAQYAAVVTNNSYTPAAEALAATNKIFLLHYSDLSNLSDIVRQMQ